MGKYNEIITPMKRRYVAMWLKIEALSGLFQDASAGGIVWKERRRQKKNKGKNDTIRYAYYQFYDKRKQKGKRKMQRYIRKNDRSWAFRWIQERRKKWEKLKELKREIKKLVNGLAAFSFDVKEIEWEIKSQKIKKEIKKAQKKPYMGRCRYLTVKGDLVRSRAERKIANTLFEKKISYVYEKTLFVQGKKVLPDFAIVYKNKLILWEHLGMMDIAEYAAKWERKKLFYEAIGFREGENLLVTTEKDLDGLTLEKIMAQFVCD